MDADLAPERTEGFKVGEKKTIDEYTKLGMCFNVRYEKTILESRNALCEKEDEALNKWKKSLGLGTGEPIADPNDPRTCIIQSLALEVEGRPDITLDLSAPGALETLKSKPFTIKEGAKYNMKGVFKVQHEVLSGLKYVQVVKRKGIRVSKDQEMIGSYPPNTTDKPTHEKKFPVEEAPSGMLARGHYDAVSKFIDDDDHTHLTFEWSFDIAKDWK